MKEMDTHPFYKFTAFLVVVVTLFFTVSALAIKEYRETINLDAWPKQEYQNSKNMLQLAAIRRILSQFDENPKVRVEIRYPGGIKGKRWGQSLLRWLVSFGIPTHYIELLPASGAADQLVVILLDKRRAVNDNDI